MHVCVYTVSARACRCMYVYVYTSARGAKCDSRWGKALVGGGGGEGRSRERAQDKRREVATSGVAPGLEPRDKLTHSIENTFYKKHIL